MKTRILIVEDEVITGMDLQESLEGLGYQVVGIAHSCRPAVEMAESERPDLVLMDIMLKGEGDGIEAAALIREQLDIPVVFLTAYSDKETLERARVTVPWGYLLKPFQEREMHVTIQMALYHAERERERTILLKRLERQVVELQAQERLMRAQMQVESVAEACQIVLEVAGGVLVCKAGKIYIIEPSGELKNVSSFGDASSSVLIDPFTLTVDGERQEVVRAEDELAVQLRYQQRQLGVLWLQGTPEAEDADTQEILGRLALEGSLVLEAAMGREELDLTEVAWGDVDVVDWLDKEEGER